jgi:flavin reductase (DIM6/NTAB) family NADH-FMN oxidoreductase RutF
MQSCLSKKDPENLLDQALSAGLTIEEFKHAFRNHPAGVAIVTTDVGNGPVALVASSVVSLSADPPLLAFSVSDFTSSAPTLRRAENVVVHLLGADHVGLAKLCAGTKADRFADAAQWSRLETGEPYFPKASNWIRGVVTQRIKAGTATLLVVYALSTGGTEAASRTAESGDGLVYHNRSWHRVGPHSRIEE